jgi:hypothetical protein
MAGALGEDIGRMVFQLVDAGQLSARPEDTLEDFRGGPICSRRWQRARSRQRRSARASGPGARHRAADTP